MPVYVYQVVREGAEGAEGASSESAGTFEVRQSIHDPPLTRHPVTGEPVRRVPCVPAITKGAPSNSELANAGFTKLVKTSDGTYEKQAGPGRT